MILLTTVMIDIRGVKNLILSIAYTLGTWLNLPPANKYLEIKPKIIYWVGYV